ncbi:MAG: nitrile hydratase subunit beta [Pseudomonadota bacterium]|nr:nitrile hydratase subunit beta [Pseudomonadota bacterium]
MFAQSWHARAAALTIAAGGLGRWSLDESRHARERLPAGDYMAYSYYEKWLAGLATLLVDHDLVSPDELARGQALEDRPAADIKAATPQQVETALRRGGPSRRPDTFPPRFSVGQQVLTRSPDETARLPGGHTRLPSYAAGRTGVIISHHHSHVLPDTNAHGLGEQAEHLYGVKFTAAELWQQTAHPDDEVCLDLWESYLAEADQS